MRTEISGRRTYGTAHARYALESDLADEVREDRIDLVRKYGMYLFCDGQYRVLGKENPDRLTSMAGLVSTLPDQGRWKVAEKREV